MSSANAHDEPLAVGPKVTKERARPPTATGPYDVATGPADEFIVLAPTRTPADVAREEAHAERRARAARKLREERDARAEREARIARERRERREREEREAERRIERVAGAPATTRRALLSSSSSSTSTSSYTSDDDFVVADDVVEYADDDYGILDIADRVAFDDRRARRAKQAEQRRRDVERAAVARAELTVRLDRVDAERRRQTLMFVLPEGRCSARVRQADGSFVHCPTIVPALEVYQTVASSTPRDCGYVHAAEGRDIMTRLCSDHAAVATLTPANFTRPGPHGAKPRISTGGDRDVLRCVSCRQSYTERPRPFPLCTANRGAYCETCLLKGFSSTLTSRTIGVLNCQCLECDCDALTDRFVADPAYACCTFCLADGHHIHERPRA